MSWGSCGGEGQDWNQQSFGVDLWMLLINAFNFWGLNEDLNPECR